LLYKGSERRGFAKQGSQPSVLKKRERHGALAEYSAGKLQNKHLRKRVLFALQGVA